MSDIQRKTCEKFYEMKGDNALYYEYRYSFKGINGEVVCVFAKVKEYPFIIKRLVKVYLNNKDILMPYFGEVNHATIS